MRQEMDEQGIEAWILAINTDNATEDLGKLTRRGSYPVLQDTEAVQAVAQLLHSGKDEFLVYDSDGVLQTWLPLDANATTSLATQEGWDRVWGAVVDASQAR